MTDITVEVPSVLASTLEGQRSLQVPLPEDGTVGGILDALGEKYPLFGRRVRDERGEVRRFVNVFVGPDNIRTLEGLGSPVREGQSVLIMQSVAGG
ncbi:MULTISPECIES: MoaD/ThiS family protein [Paeniglutamicibacter]|uniref:Molybdopterin converting factor small subunit n=1 Tax=Paeniglutamicibacter sulfureus TaxID=43666 RepID=A0ABU2BJW4_9MICC|nr:MULTISPECIES: MoaD/ThiS family protein [Paeniglutamicibacter]MCV9995868.1 MoaD/ThiS family protein [Paeniglutamicibacter sp. ZC-3]MDO2934337.1 MoaD/ThiS family protein [Paeniglutamicibacter sulfureus]MDR7358526.1 molybdopterin converting factor small subunit [Paeniglutamicibacter sulfureus]